MADVVLTDPQGRRVELADATWDEHVTMEHAEMKGQRGPAEAAITSPVAIHASVNQARHPTGVQYFGRCPRRGLYIMVATEEITDAAGTRRIVKTAHYVGKVGAGSRLWP